MGKRPKPEVNANDLITVEAPLGDLIPDQYEPRHVDAHLTAQQARALRRLRNGLDERHERLRGGKVVQTAPDAVRWLLEQLAEEE